MPLNLGHRYGDPQFSDVELVYEVLAADNQPSDAPRTAVEPPVKRKCIRLSIQTIGPVGNDPGSSAAPALLKMVPGHMVVLSEIPYLANQMERWPSRSSSDQARAVITLDKAEHLAAAETVVQTVYGDADALQQLKPRDMVQAILLADLMTLPASLVVVPGCSILQAYPEWEEVLQALAVVPALPDFLLPVVAAVCRAWAGSAQEDGARPEAHKEAMRTLLLNTFGNLEAAWGQPETSRQLLDLPPACMLLLLESSNLQVVSEDNVLFTVEAYIEEYGEQQVPQPQLQPPLSEHTVSALRDLVRFHHLSKDGQVRALVSGLAAYRTVQIRRYMQLRLAGEDITPGDIRRFVTDAPGCWDLPPRRLLAAAPYSGRAELSWTVPVADIKDACEDACEKLEQIDLHVPACTPPRRGQAWCIDVTVDWDDERHEIDVGVFCMAHPAALGVIVGKVSVRVQAGAREIFRITSVMKVCSSKCLGWRGAIITGMAGGWDEAAWVAKGLPLEGSLQVHLAVDDP